MRGSVKVLTDVLSLANPTAFGHASRVRQVVQKLCAQLNVEQAWQCEIAAMLSQIGCVTVPPDTLAKIYHGQSVKADELQMFEAHPEVGRDLVANIPRLEQVAQIIAYQHKHFDGSGNPTDSLAGTDIPLGARILKVALDYNTLTWSEDTDARILAELRMRSGWYDPEILAALETIAGLEAALEVVEIGVKDLRTRMILAADVMANDGTLLIGKGQEVTPAMYQRLRNFAKTRGVVEPVYVLTQTKASSRLLQKLGKCVSALET